MAEIPVALQLHSIREECKRDLQQALNEVGAMGYDGVEFAGYFGHTAAQIREFLSSAGLAVAGTHSYWASGSMDEENLSDTIAFNQTLGNRFLVGGIEGAPQELRGTRAAWVEMANRYNRASDLVAPAGMRVGYHNHAIEFETIVDGERVWDILLGALSKDIILQLDTAGPARAGLDCTEVIRSQPGRFGTVHLKPYSHSEGTRALIGEDDLPWKDILALCRSIGGTEWFIVEYESDGYPRMEAVARCLKAIRELMG